MSESKSYLPLIHETDITDEDDGTLWWSYSSFSMCIKYPARYILSVYTVITVLDLTGLSLNCVVIIW